MGVEFYLIIPTTCRSDGNATSAQLSADADDFFACDSRDDVATPELVRCHACLKWTRSIDVFEFWESAYNSEPIAPEKLVEEGRHALQLLIDKFSEVDPVMDRLLRGDGLLEVERFGHANEAAQMGHMPEGSPSAEVHQTLDDHRRMLKLCICDLSGGEIATFTDLTPDSMISELVERVAAAKGLLMPGRPWALVNADRQVVFNNNQTTLGPSQHDQPCENPSGCARQSLMAHNIKSDQVLTLILKPDEGPEDRAALLYAANRKGHVLNCEIWKAVHAEVSERIKLCELDFDEVYLERIIEMSTDMIEWGKRGAYGLWSY